MTTIVSPILISAIPDQVVNEGLAFSMDLRDYIRNLSPRSGDITFTVSLFNGERLPPGLACSREGVIAGMPHVGTAQSEPYSLLIIAKNKADVPLIAEMNLRILSVGATPDGPVDNPEADPAMQHASADLPDGFNDSFWAMFGEDENGIETLVGPNQWFEKLSDKKYQQFFVEYLLRKFSSLQIYNADYAHADVIEKTVCERSTAGWPIMVDGHFAMATSNPDPFASTLNRGAFIQTVREMVIKATEKGWKTIGVAGFDKNLGWRLVREYNVREQTKPLNQQRILGYDDVFQDKEWVEQLFSNKLPAQQLNASDGL